MSNHPAATLARTLGLPCGRTSPNRLLKSAMSEALADRGGIPGRRLETLYGRFADGGVGICVTGNVMIDGRALGEPGNVVVESTAALPGLRRWAAAGTRHGTQLWMQLNHPGKQSPAFLSPEPVAPSAIPFGSNLRRAFNPPRALTETEILDLIARFGRSAALAREAGFSGVQIHAAHGYLVSQFLSPLHNRRADAWGGDPARRRAFLLAIVAEIRRAAGADFALSVKLNSGDFQTGGLEPAEALGTVAALAEAGIDLIEVSGGTYEAPAMIASRVQAGEAYFLDFARRARAAVATPIAATGGFRTVAAMAAAIADGACDVVGLARPLAVDPDLPRRILAGEVVEARRPRVSTGIRALDRAGFLGIVWHEAQLARLAAGFESKPDLGAWPALAWVVARGGLNTLRKRRA